MIKTYEETNKLIDEQFELIDELTKTNKRRFHGKIHKVKSNSTNRKKRK